MKTVLCICLCMLALSGSNAYCNEIPLGWIQTGAGIGEYGIINELNICWVDNDTDRGHLMDFGNFSADDIGTKVSIDSTTSVNFNFYTSPLTDGIDGVSCEIWQHTANAWSGYDPPDSLSLQKFVDSPYVDFYGYQITRIELTINSISFVSPGYNPNNTGLWTDWSVDETFTIYGTPEPCSLALLSLGSLLLRRRKK